MSVVRIAIVGAGPKGTSALERLAHHVGRGAATTSFDVDVYEPHPHPGAGPVYDPRHPDFLRMNVSAEVVDAWWAPDRGPDDAARPSFATWRRLTRPADMSAFPPRATVGRYLADAFAAIVATAPPAMRVRVVARRVVDVAPDDGRWLVLGEAGEADAAPYDEVLLATGHAASWSGALSRGVFPVDEQLSVEHVPAGATVAVRGFALTFIDAALALTEGRGGSFHALDHPWRLRYEPGANDVAVLRPFTRSGRTMLAKPVPHLLVEDARAAATIAEGCARIRALGPGLDVRSGLLPIVADVVAALADVDATAWLRAAVDGSSRSPSDPGEVTAVIARSLDVGHGLAPADAAWALGHAWRGLYPAIVERAGGAGLRGASSWRDFQRLATELERVAFGPPPVNAAKLLALVDAGRVDLAHLRDEPGARAGADVVVDAVLAPPGAGSLAAGEARVVPGRRGFEVGADGTCTGHDGVPVRGLAAIGRPTEDSTIGNDTLSRALHPLADLWAQRVVATSARELPDRQPITTGRPT